MLWRDFCIVKLNSAHLGPQTERKIVYIGLEKQKLQKFTIYKEIEQKVWKPKSNLEKNKKKHPSKPNHQTIPVIHSTYIYTWETFFYFYLFLFLFYLFLF